MIPYSVCWSQTSKPETWHTAVTVKVGKATAAVSDAIISNSIEHD